jgi:replicative DNA helicase
VSEALLPPQAIEAEQHVLGALLLDNAAWDRVGDVISAADFYRLSHRLIFAQIAQLIEQNKPADAFTVAEALECSNKLVGAGDRAYLAELACNTPSVASIRRYAEVVKDRSQKRSVIAVASRMLDQGHAPGASAAELVATAHDELYRLQMAQQHGLGRSFAAALSAVVVAIDERHTRGGSDVVGVASGYVDLDRMTTGFHPGELIVIAGRPSMGKTALGMGIVEHVAIEQALPALVFSLEMSAEELAQRLLGSRARVDLQELRTGRFDESHWEQIVAASTRLNDAPITVEESSSVTIQQIRAIAHRTFRERGSLGLIVIDYLQLMSTAGETNRNLELGDISRGLKGLAKELQTPVIALSQLNRDVEKRPNHRPVISDLRDSGAIEQDADLVLLLYRDEVYDKHTPNPGVAEVSVAKQRNGPVGHVRLTFLERFARFENFVGEFHEKSAKPRSKPFGGYSARARVHIDG